MSEHTPGPWLREGTFVYSLKDGQNWFWLDVQSLRSPVSEREANARLISKAWLLPEMVEALREWVATCSVTHGHPRVCADCDRTKSLLQRYDEAGK